MAHMYNISEDGLELIKAYEGFRPVETVLVSGQKVIGYGHPYIRGEASLLTQKKAEEILKSDLEPIEKIINHIVFAPISQNQFDAMVSLAFNIGIDDFADSSVLHYLNNGQPLAAAAGFDEWRKSTIVDQTYIIDALVRRRTAEKYLFLSPESGAVAAPRYDLPVLHDSTVNDEEDDIEIFGKFNSDDFVAQAPYEDGSVQGHHRDNGSAEALMLSERRAAPQIFEDVVIDNVVDIKPIPEVKPEQVVTTEPPQEEGLSPIALAAADVSERLDNLMEERKTEADVKMPADESVAPENVELQSVNESVSVEEPVAIVEPVIVEPKIVETGSEETGPEETGPGKISPEETETLKPKNADKPEQIAPEGTPPEKVKGVGAFWATLGIGLLLIAASLWQMKFAPITNLGALGEFFAPVVLLVGAMMIMGGMFYMIKAQLRRG